MADSAFVIQREDGQFLEHDEYPYLLSPPSWCEGLLMAYKVGTIGVAEDIKNALPDFDVEIREIKMEIVA